MRSRMRLQARWGQFPFYLGLAGCSSRSAPTLSLFGAYFPVWIVCGLIGALAAGVVQVILARSGAADVVPAQLVVCSGAGLIVACLAWLALSH